MSRARRDIVFTRSSGWIPNVIREEGELKLMLAAGADANHEPRVFTVPIFEAHLAVIRENLARHLLLWSAVGSATRCGRPRRRRTRNAPRSITCGAAAPNAGWSWGPLAR